MNIIKKIITIIVLLIIAFIYSHIDKQHEIYNSEVDSSEYISTGILVDETLEQDFYCMEDCLSGIWIKCASVGENKDVDVMFTISCDEGAVIRTQEVAGTEIKNNKFFKLRFDDIKGCKNKKMHLLIEFSGGDEANGLSIYYENSDGENQYFRNEKAMAGTLLVKTITHRFDFETFFVVLLFEAYLIAFMMIMSKLFK